MSSVFPLPSLHFLPCRVQRPIYQAYYQLVAHIFPIMLTLHAPPTSLQSQDSSLFGSKVAISLLLVNCRCALNKRGHLSRFAAPANHDIIFITGSWLNQETPNSVTSSWDIISFRCSGIDHRVAVALSMWGNLRSNASYNWADPR